MFAFRPVPSWRIALGPGFELVDKDKSDGSVKKSAHFVTAIRTIYEFHLGKITVGPTLGIDLIGETDTNLVYGLTVGPGF